MTELKQHKNIAIGGRVSTDKQNVISVQSQIDIIQEAYQKDVPDGKVHYVDAKVISAYRGGMMRVKEIYNKLRDHNRKRVYKVTLFLLLDWTRWYRNVEDAWQSILDFKKIGVEINTVQRWIDFSDPHAKAMLGMELAYAEASSKATGKHVKRCLDHRVKSGKFTLPRPPKFWKRVWNESRTAYTIEKTLVWKPYRAAVVNVMSGLGIRESFLRCGGRSVLKTGEDAFSQMLRNRLLIGEFQGHPVDVPALLSASEFATLQKSLNNRKPMSASEISRAAFYLKPSILCPLCHSRLTSDPAKSGKHCYYTCFQDSPRHFRVPIKLVHDHWNQALKELTLSADSTRRLNKLAHQRTREDRRAAMLEVNRVKEQLNEFSAIEDGALFKYSAGKISESAYNRVLERGRDLSGQLADAKMAVEQHAERLQLVLQSLQGISLLIAEKSTPAQMSDFVRMMFPDGIAFDRKNKVFRTNKPNQVFGILFGKSVSYTKIKTRPPSQMESDLVMSGWQGRVRTLSFDRDLFNAYNERYKTA